MRFKGLSSSKSGRKTSEDVGVMRQAVCRTTTEVVAGWRWQCWRLRYRVIQGLVIIVTSTFRVLGLGFSTCTHGLGVVGAVAVVDCSVKL